MLRIGPWRVLGLGGLRVNPVASSLTRWVRYQSLNHKSEKSQYDDEKLRKIIESTNLGYQKSLKSTAENEKPVDTKIQDTLKHIPDQTKILSSQINTSEQNTNQPLFSDIQQEIQDLPSAKEEKRSQLARRLEVYLDSLQDTIFTATRALNDVTGYSSIEKLKASIDVLENQLKEAKEDVKKCKLGYSEAILNRSKLQREVNELLTRKHNWSSEDLERFTDLYRNDHTNEQREAETEICLSEAEQKVDAIQLKLTQLILTRYHEEQIWSDKIRRSSTWGTWILTGINIFLFVIATFLVEPWKRKRLVGSFEDKVRDVLIGIAQQEPKLLEPILKNGEMEKVKDAHQEAHQDQETHQETHPETQQETQTPLISMYPFSVKLLQHSWQGFTQMVWLNYAALASKDITKLQFDKVELSVLVGLITILGGCMGSAITLYFK